MISKKVILDTNSILRFITNDDTVRSQKVIDLLSNNDCLVPIEVIAEAVYNLEKYYRHPRQLIAEEIKDFVDIKENLVVEENVVRYGCNTFSTTNLDFIDCLLVAYAYVRGNPIFSFDEGLNKRLQHKAYGN